MKKFYFGVLLLVLSFNLFSQVPNKIAYQGILTDQNGQIVLNNDYALTFKLYDTIVGGTALWTELQVTPVINGIFNVMLGNVNPIALPFNKQYYLGVIVGAGNELAPRTVLTSNPYSLRSKTVDEINGKPLSNTPPTNGQVLGFNGTQWQPTNITTDGISGTGISGYIPLFSNSNTLSNSIIKEYNGSIGINTDINPINGLRIGKSTLQNSYVSLVGSLSTGISMTTGPYNSSIYQNSSGNLMFSFEGDSEMRFLRNGHLLLGETFVDTAVLNIRSNDKQLGSLISTYDGLTSVFNVILNANSNWDSYGIHGASYGNPGYGIGGDFKGNYIGVQGSVKTPLAFPSMGVYGNNSATGTANKYGVYGTASGNSDNSNRYGVYGHANWGTINYGVYANGNLGYTGTLIGPPANKNFKANNKLVGNILDKIIQLSPEYFSYKTEEYPSMNFAKGNHYGLNAEELEKTFPELVSDNVNAYTNVETKESIETKYKGINYIELIPILIQAIKDQQVQIEELKQKVSELSK